MIKLRKKTIEKHEIIDEENKNASFSDIDKSKKKIINKKIIISIVSVVTIFILCSIFSILFVPKIKLNGETYEKISLNNKYFEKGASATYNGKNVSNKLNINGNVDVSKIGKYEIEYTISEGIFKKKVKRTVEVIDDISPVINLIGKKNVEICPNQKYKEDGYEATDNYDGNLTDKVIVLEKDNLISYSVKDSSKNETIVTREVKKIDKEKPKIKLNGSSIIYVVLNSKYNDSGVKVEDNCDKNLSSKVKTTGEVNVNKVGTYTITYEVLDESQNKSQVTRTVIVYEKANSIPGANKKGIIYLTFDDGPSASITPKILEILKEKGVKATFFVINKSNSLDYLIKQAYNDGHTIGLHSYTHKYDAVYSSPNAYFEDLTKIQNKVNSLIGENSKIIRFPGGSSNTISRKYSKGIMTYLANEVINKGYHYFDWNVSSGDAGEAKNKNDVYKNVTKGLSHNRINVVLMHDFENNYKTLNALSDIIDYGINNGYIFSSIDMNTPLIIHGTNN